MYNHELCNCYHFIRKEIPAHDGTGRIIMSGYGVCYGTKECNQCYCGGDTDKCDFYPEKRKAATKPMNTAEMWLKAQEDGKTYQCNDLFYNKKHGFIDSNFQPWPINCVDFIDDVFSWVDWHECKTPLMTKTEAEEKFGIKIVD